MKIYLINLLFICSLYAGTYDDLYSVNKDSNTSENVEKDFFMNGNFLEIKRFDKLDFSDGNLSADSREKFKEIVDTVKNYIEDKKTLNIKVIGHAKERTDIHNENVVESDTFMSSFQNMFKYSQDLNKTTHISKNFATRISNKLEDNNISKEIIVVEYRGSKDLAFTTATDQGLDQSNRVMVTIYVSAPKDKDSDKDSVLNSIDMCPKTPIGIEVNEEGCPLDLDRDGTYDSLDECGNTPLGVSVDEVGCPLDSDSDGVLDYKDNCPDTISLQKVDANGCEIVRELHINFKRRSAEITNDAFDQIDEFVEFLNINNLYKVQIIGHTDSVGMAGNNMRLSFDRAHSVKNMLVEKGIEADRVEAIGRGELDPIQTNRTAQGRATNRRIEVKILK